MKDFNYICIAINLYLYIFIFLYKAVQKETILLYKIKCRTFKSIVNVIKNNFINIFLFFATKWACCENKNRTTYIKKEKKLRISDTF